MKKKKRYYPKKRPVVKAEGDDQAGGEVEGSAGGEDGGEVVKKPRRKKYDGPVFGATKTPAFFLAFALASPEYCCTFQSGVCSLLRCLPNTRSICRRAFDPA